MFHMTLPNFVWDLPIAMFSFRVDSFFPWLAFHQREENGNGFSDWVPWERSDDTFPHSSWHCSLGGYVSSPSEERKMPTPSEVLRWDLRYHQKWWHQWNMGSSISAGLNPSIHSSIHLSIHPSIHPSLQLEYLFRNNYVPRTVTGAAGKGIRYNPCPWEPHGQTRETSRELITAPVRLSAGVCHLYVKCWRGDSVIW